MLSACSFTNTGKGNISKGEYEDRFTQQEHYIADFSKGYPQGFYLRNDRGNGNPFNCSFSKDNAEFINGVMNLHLTTAENERGYAGAELCSVQTFGYGYYSFMMKPAKCQGVISSFFTYIGWPWHEIDIEFLGHNTNIVQFNHYTDGVGGHEYFYELGFDASLDYHEYGFDWNEDSIIYFVDGVAVYKTITQIPSVPSKIMMNLWNVHESNTSWAGKFDPSKLPVTSSYKWIGYQTQNV